MNWFNPITLTLSVGFVFLAIALAFTSNREKVVYIMPSGLCCEKMILNKTSGKLSFQECNRDNYFSYENPHYFDEISRDKCNQKMWLQ